MTPKINELFAPSLNDFVQATGNYKVPAIIRGGVAHWPATSLWSSEYFNAKYGQVVVSISTSKDGVYSGDPELGFKFYEEMCVSDFFKRMSESGDNSRHYYWQQQHFDERFSALERDIMIPPFAGSVSAAPHLWIGPAGAVSPLHYDSVDNLFAQIRGSKAFIVFDPAQSDYLYSHPQESQTPHISRVNPEHPSLTLFPKFAFAEPFHGTLNSGDLLFIPKGWWHHVRSLTDSMSVNLWSMDEGGFSVPASETPITTVCELAEDVLLALEGTYEFGDLSNTRVTVSKCQGKLLLTTNGVTLPLLPKSEFEFVSNKAPGTFTFLDNQLSICQLNQPAQVGRRK
jgi:hypothetical protein